MNYLRLALALACLLPAACGPAPWQSERAARDRIMLVRRSPETLGFERLTAQASEHPDLAMFLRREGEPDFIAETASDNRRYLILYYLESEKAWACRTWARQPAGIEFAGPYPITPKEATLLAELKRQSVPSTASGIASGRLVIPEDSAR